MLVTSVQAGLLCWWQEDRSNRRGVGLVARFGAIGVVVGGKRFGSIGKVLLLVARGPD